MSTTTTLSEMSFLVSNEGGQQELSPHSKHSLVMNGSPRNSSQQQRLTSIDTTNAFAGSIFQGSPVHTSPTSNQSESPTNNSRVPSNVIANTYPPATHPASRKSIDQTLLTPTSNTNTNRQSSPARIPSTDGATDIQIPKDSNAPDSPRRNAPRLQHRHTLEIPQVTPNKQSKDSQSRVSDDLPNGRLSGSLPSRRRRASLTLGRRHTRSYNSDIGADGHVPEDNTSRLGEAIIGAKRPQRPSAKRRRRDDDDDDQVLVGTKVDQNHANWVTAYNMLTGIRCSVSRTNAKMDRELNDADFQTANKYPFDM